MRSDQSPDKTMSFLFDRAAENMNTVCDHILRAIRDTTAFQRAQEFLIQTRVPGAAETDEYKFFWMVHDRFKPVSDLEADAISSLMGDGWLVPALPVQINLRGGNKTLRLQHFEDVQFGRDKNNNLYVYQLGMPHDQFRKMTPQDGGPVRERLLNLSRFNNVVEGDAIDLKKPNGQHVTLIPLITDPQAILLKNRQAQQQRALTQSHDGSDPEPCA